MNSSEKKAAIAHLCNLYPKATLDKWPQVRRDALMNKLSPIALDLEQFQAVAGDIAMNRRDWCPPESFLLSRLREAERGGEQLRGELPTWLEVWKARQDKEQVQHDGSESETIRWEAWRQYAKMFRRAKEEHRPAIVAAFREECRRMYARRNSKAVTYDDTEDYAPQPDERSFAAWARQYSTPENRNTLNYQERVALDSINARGLKRAEQVIGAAP